MGDKKVMFSLEIDEEILQESSQAVKDGQLENSLEILLEQNPWVKDQVEERLVQMAEEAIKPTKNLYRASNKLLEQKVDQLIRMVLKRAPGLNKEMSYLKSLMRLHSQWEKTGPFLDKSALDPKDRRTYPSREEKTR